MHISILALRLLGLDQVWWLVSPQNPLKPTSGMAPFDERFASAVAVAAHHPRILVSDIERQLGTRYTADTLTALTERYPATHFVWLMGADNLGQMHRWQRWREIFERMPVAVFDRPPYRIRMLSSPAARAFAAARVGRRRSRQLAEMPPPAWTFFPSRLHPLSSTQIRSATRARTRRLVGAPRAPTYVLESPPA